MNKIQKEPFYCKFPDQNTSNISSKIVYRWEKLFNDYGSDYSMYRTIELHRLLLEGVPYEYKARVWGTCSGAYAEMKLNPNEYESLLAKSTKTDCSQLTMEEIERDLHRYFIIKGVRV